MLVAKAATSKGGINRTIIIKASKTNQQEVGLVVAEELVLPVSRDKHRDPKVMTETLRVARVHLSLWLPLQWIN
jgi:hypothetical protein